MWVLEHWVEDKKGTESRNPLIQGNQKEGSCLEAHHASVNRYSDNNSVTAVGF